VVVYSSSPNKYRNEDVEQQAAKLQAEFEALMNSRDKPKNEFWSQTADRDGFYSMMTDFYKFERHDSPTTRLRHQKDSTCESKDILNRSMPQNSSDYKLTYITKPGRADVMEPGRELNYNLAYKDPVKFIDEVLAKETQQTTLKEGKAGFGNREEKASCQAAELQKAPSLRRKTAVPHVMTTRMSKVIQPNSLISLQGMSKEASPARSPGMARLSMSGGFERQSNARKTVTMNPGTSIHRV